MSKVYSVILAAGSGVRMKTKEKKQYIELNGKPVVFYSIDKFLSIKSINKIVLVIGEKDKNSPCVKKIIDHYKEYIYSGKIYMILGGKERYDSVYNSLNFLYDNFDINKDDKVLIHDSARPNVDISDIKKLITVLKKHKVVTLATNISDTIKEVIPSNVISKVVKTLDRSKYYLIKTPQGFNLRLLINAYDKFYPKKRKYKITDDLQIIENFTKEKTYVLNSSKDNIKITEKEDIELLKLLIK